MFGGINGTNSLEDCCKLHAQVGWQALKKDEHRTGEYILLIGKDFKDGKVDYSTCIYVSKELYNMAPYIQVQNGEKYGSIHCFELLV